MRLIPACIFLIATLILSSCFGPKKSVVEKYKYELYVDHKYISYSGQNASQSAKFYIDSTNGMWYHGKLILNNSDTLSLEGFEKGSRHPSQCKSMEGKDIGDIFIDMYCEPYSIVDSIRISDIGQRDTIIDGEIIMYRQTK
jgi:hypothetical protein